MPRPKLRNSKAELRKWSIQTLASSSLDRVLILELLFEADYSINRLGWRGDISDKWKKYSPLVTTATVPDLYV